ncbi:hypothetical protein ACFPMF_03175 [Larkinella bovis]|uniref:Uncharacterized protein n=1 Tax=Larkinella bovis TaxID=683041 RepID=A0ABW0I440_9BACT
MRFFIRTPFYVGILLLLSTSCTRREEDCGCDGSTNRTIENLPARYAGDGAFMIADTNGGFFSVSACAVDPAWEVSYDEKNWNYTLSGDVKKRCLGPHPELVLPAPGGPIRITSIKKNN